MPRPIVHVSDPLARRHTASICIASRMLGVKWLGLVGDPTLFRGREIKVRKFYRAFELAGAVAGEKDQRHMDFDDIDPLGLSPVQATGR